MGRQRSIGASGATDTRVTTKLSGFGHGIAAVLIGACVVSHLCAQHSPVRVLVWHEQDPEQAQAYDNFLGNKIAAYLKKQPGLEVRSVRLDDANQGITDKSLDETDVLVWWGHERHGELAAEISLNIVERIKAGKLSLIALHSAHWSSPHGGDGRAHSN